MRNAELRSDLLHSVHDLPESGVFDATLQARGLFNTFQYVLRLSPAVHRQLAAQPSGLVSSIDMTFEGAQAFSTLLHETVHWWQHVGSTYGLMMSLSYPTQAHANYDRLRDLIRATGFRKSIRRLTETLTGERTPISPLGMANIVANNHFDFTAFRSLTLGPETAKAASSSGWFESVGHAFEITYGNNLLVLAPVADPAHEFLPHPRDWERQFAKLKNDHEEGYYYGSPVGLWPLGAREIMEGQACFIQIQYLAFASGGRLGWADFRALGMLHGVYEAAFALFLDQTDQDWPATIDHPLVGLFLLICDLALNPGAGFPFPLKHFSSFINDVDPSARFTMLAAVVRLRCPDVLTAIREYSRAEYEAVSELLTAALIVDSPLSIALTFAGWTENSATMSALMKEYETYDYGAGNLPVRVMFSHFLAFMKDKLARPEFFCWAGAWMAGSRVDASALDLFERHSALFIDKEDDDGIFPSIRRNRDSARVQSMFDAFYAGNVIYDMTAQWIVEEGPFRYDYRWLSQTGSAEEIKAFADRHFEMIYGVHPDAVQLSEVRVS